MGESQDLCSECGLCCSGALHERVPLQEEEVVPLLKLVPKCVFRIQGQPKMQLPCKAHKKNSCSIYNERPSRCRAYLCKLLKKYLSSEVPKAEAIAIIQQAKEDLTNKAFLYKHFDESMEN